MIAVVISSLTCWVAIYILIVLLYLGRVRYKAVYFQSNYISQSGFNLYVYFACSENLERWVEIFVLNVWRFRKFSV